jgi:hypothetical protein
MRELKGLNNLEDLNLFLTQVGDHGLVHLKGLKKLKHLSLWLTRVTDSGLEHLEALTNLQTLDLQSTAITDSGLKHLQGLTNFQVLNWRQMAEVLAAAAKKTPDPVRRRNRTRMNALGWFSSRQTSPPPLFCEHAHFSA